MPELFSRFGGHKQAAGLTLHSSRLPDFEARLAAFAQQKLTPDDLRPEYLVDAEAHFPELTESTVSELLGLGPFGFGNPSPILLARKAEVAGPPKTLKEDKHYNVPLRHNGRLLFCKAWNFAHRIHLLQPGASVDVLFQVEDDPGAQKRGYAAWSICLKDVRPAV
jgi:single-stranded-DNA-specific exonuclease